MRSTFAPGRGAGTCDKMIEQLLQGAPPRRRVGLWTDAPNVLQNGARITLPGAFLGMCHAPAADFDQIWSPRPKFGSDRPHVRGLTRFGTAAALCGLDSPKLWACSIVASNNSGALLTNCGGHFGSGALRTDPNPYTTHVMVTQGTTKHFVTAVALKQKP